MERKAVMLIAIAVVAVVIIAAVAYIFWPQEPEEKKTLYWVQVVPKDQQASFISGEIDAGVSWEPYCSDSILGGDAHVLKWSGEIWPNHPCCVVAVKTTFLTDHRDLVTRMVRAHIDADLWIIDTLDHPGSANYTLLMQIGAQFSGRSTEVVEAATEHIKYSYQLTSDVLDAFEDFTQMFIDLNQTSLGDDYSSVEAFVDDLVDSAIITDALLVQPSETVLGTVNLGYLAGDLHQFARVVAMNSSIGNGKTLYEKYGLNVVPANLAGYINGPAVMDAFAGGVIDVGYLGAPPAILKKLNVGTDIKVVALANSEGSAILAVDGINSFDELENKTVGTPGPGSIQHLLLLYYADQQGFVVKYEGT